jgi:hypothetical protein
MEDVIREFHRFGFEPAYETEVDPEFPSTAIGLLLFSASIGTVTLRPSSCRGGATR